MRALLIVAALAGAAAAQPRPVDPPCLPSGKDIALRSDSSGVYACVDASTCLRVEANGTVTRKLPTAGADLVAAPIRHDGAAVSLCNNGACKKVGTRVAFEVVAAERDALDAQAANGTATVDARISADGKIATVNGRAYVVATDKPLALTPPKEWKTLPAKPVANPKLLRVDVAGAVLVATWADGDCDGAGGCHAVTVDTAGKIKSGSWFSPGVIIAMSPDVAVVVGNDPTEITTVTRTGDVWIAHLSDGNIGPVALRTSNDTLVVATSAGGYEMRWLKLANDKPAQTTSRAPIAHCTRKP